MSDRPAALRRVPTPGHTATPDRSTGTKRALFSDEIIPPAMGSVALHCTKCDSRSVVSMVQAAKLATPMMYIPLRAHGQGLDEVPVV